MDAYYNNEHYATGSSSAQVRAGRNNAVTVQMIKTFYIAPCANGHSFIEWEETSAATCTEAAINTEKCSVCDTLGTVTQAGHHALGHSAGAAGGAIEATCEVNGYTGTGACVRCSIELTGEVIDAFGHHYHDWTEPDCTTAGNSQRECNNDCGTIDMRDTGYAALGHDHTSSLICKRENCDHQYAIGGTGPAGGIIFYVADGEAGRPDGITIQGYGNPGDTGYFAEYTAYYLEAASGYEYSLWQAGTVNNTFIDGITTWATNVEREAGLAASIGVGRKDTQTIVNSTAFAVLTDTVAQKCASKNLNGFTDWFLPSLGELDEMYKVAGVIGMQTLLYWSSSQYNSNNAWMRNFSNGGYDIISKRESSRAHAVRAF